MILKGGGENVSLKLIYTPETIRINNYLKHSLKFYYLKIIFLKNIILIISYQTTLS